MVFNELYFLFVFFPLAVMLHYITPTKFRCVTLVVISLLFYGWGSPAYILILLFSILFNYLSGLQMAECRAKDSTLGARIIMLLSVVVNLSLLGFYKYYGFLVDTLNGLFHLSLRHTALPLPIGISFFTFSALSYILDVYRQEAPPEKNPIHLAVYLSFFPKVVSGPIVPYRDMQEQLRSRVTAPAKIGAGLNLMLCGLAKKVLIADQLGIGFSAIRSLGEMSSGTALLGLLLYTLQLYFDFSGYSDMAIGLAKIFGFDFDKNFDHPYLSPSVGEFWRRWHISLGAWFRTYVYIPLGGSRGSALATFRNYLVVWLLTGLWHGASWNFVVWGLYHCCFILLERFVLTELLNKIPKAIRVVFTFLAVAFGWCFFFTGSLSESFLYISRIFGSSGLGFLDSTALYYLKNYAILLVIALFGTTPVLHGLHQQITYHRSSTLIPISILFYVAVLVLCTAYMVGNTYSSFLYFQF